MDVGLLIFIIIVAVFYILIIVSFILNAMDKKFCQNLLDDDSTDRFVKLNVDRLELKRMLRTYHIGSLKGDGRVVEKQIPLQSPIHDKTMNGYQITQENVLAVDAWVKNRRYKVYSCPYCDENKSKLSAFVEKYNSMVSAQISK